ncbi:phosphatase PAP2 family protein [Blastococcus sp. URHD0036]|uniref:phosphatase PAP2 family protein n=1 Tax=Blastococcus sp. URHD0036 TaxID=1380356 RepID=UPI001E2DCDE3|nr:phosphatase PAP2 family protein [Blastococcus sp. URHD0036]
MTSGVERRSAGPSFLGEPVAGSPAVVSVGRPPWWALLLAALITVVVTVDVLGRGVTERIDVRVSDWVAEWDLRDSAAYPPLWVVTQIGGRGTMLVVLAGLIIWLAVRRHTLLPLPRVLVALLLLSVTVYSVKWGIGRTAPGHAGLYLHHEEGASYPSGHVANAVLLWGVARWQAVQFGMPPTAQRVLWGLAVIGPVVCALAMIALDFHWFSDAVVGAALGVLLLGVVHALDALILSRWVRVRAGRPLA